MSDTTSLAAGRAGAAAGVTGAAAPGPGRAGTRLAAGLGSRGGSLHPHTGGRGGLSPARVHQITAGADLNELDAALGELRAAGWPAPEDPGGDDDGELDGRDLAYRMVPALMQLGDLGLELRSARAAPPGLLPMLS
jgi:hypothetical protein